VVWFRHRSKPQGVRRVSVSHHRRLPPALLWEGILPGNRLSCLALWGRHPACHSKAQASCLPVCGADILPAHATPLAPIRPPSEVAMADTDALSFKLAVEITDPNLVEWLTEIPEEHLGARVQDTLRAGHFVLNLVQAAAGEEQMSRYFRPVTDQMLGLKGILDEIMGRASASQQIGKLGEQFAVNQLTEAFPGDRFEDVSGNRRRPTSGPGSTSATTCRSRPGSRSSSTPTTSPPPSSTSSAVTSRRPASASASWSRWRAG
jgi:hypothetical protein